MKGMDLSLVVGILIVLPLGVYKVFYDNQNPYSVLFGLFLILVSAYLTFDLIKTLKKEFNDHRKH